jgi:hypothetical protein
VLLFQHTLPGADAVSLRAKIRKGFYVAMVASEDEESQKKGSILVSYLIGTKSTWKQVAERKAYLVSRAQLGAALPMRVEAVHFCFESIILISSSLSLPTLV